MGDWQFELAVQDAAGSGDGEVHSICARGQRQRQIGDQQAFADFRFPTEEENALRRQQPRFYPAKWRVGGLLAE
jgi:hypothetical protein